MEALIVFVLGAISGSFLNVCISRIPEGESVIWPSSRCRSCGTPIAPYDNIPLLSYVILRARCRFCAQQISARYFFVELLTGMLFLALYFRFGIGGELMVALLLTAALIVISFIDLHVRIVPDVISLPGIVLGLLISLLWFLRAGSGGDLVPTPLSSLIGIISGGGFLLATAWLYEKLTGVEGMGGGDIKLLAMIGAFLGWPAVPVSLFLASLAGSVVGLACMILTGAGRRLALPFAPFLCVGALIFIFLGDEIIGFYLSAD